MYICINYHPWKYRTFTPMKIQKALRYALPDITTPKDNPYSNSHHHKTILSGQPFWIMLFTKDIMNRNDWYKVWELRVSWNSLGWYIYESCIYCFLKTEKFPTGSIEFHIGQGAGFSLRYLSPHRMSKYPTLSPTLFKGHLKIVQVG